MIDDCDFVKQNVQDIINRINYSAEKLGKTDQDIKLIAVTKTVPISEITKVLDIGICDFGENRVQELADKYLKIEGNVNWHMIGHLQTNKVKKIIQKVCMIHSLDNYDLANEIQNRAYEAGKVIDVLIQVNISGELTKYGVPSENAIELIKKISEFKNIKIKGLMTIAPFVQDPEKIRWVFAKLRELSIDIAEKRVNNIEMEYLSMGMSNDFEIAIEEGANILRIGSKIFGDRKY